MMTEFRILSETIPLTLFWVTSEVKGEVYFTKITSIISATISTPSTHQEQNRESEI